jgi:hypothetical protein
VPNRALFVVPLLAQLGPAAATRLQPPTSTRKHSNHGGLRLFALIRAPDRRRNVRRYSRSDSEEAVTSEKEEEEEEHHHLELLQTPLALAASTEAGAFAAA